MDTAGSDTNRDAIDLQDQIVLSTVTAGDELQVILESLRPSTDDLDAQCQLIIISLLGE